MRRVVLPVIILMACAFFANFLVRNPSQLEEVALEIIPVAVRVIEVEKGTVGLSVGSQGKVQAAQTVNLSAAVAGPVAWISPICKLEDMCRRAILFSGLTPVITKRCWQEARQQSNRRAQKPGTLLESTIA